MSFAKHIAPLASTLFAATAAAQDAPYDVPDIEALDPAPRAYVENLFPPIEEALTEERYVHALALIDDALRLYDHPSLWIKRAKALEALGREREASALIARTLEVWPDATEAPALKVKLQDLKNREDAVKRQSVVGSLRIDSSPPGATVEFRDRPGRLKGTTPTVPLPITRSTTLYLKISKDGYEATERVVEVDAGEHHTLLVDLERAPSQPQQTASLSEEAEVEGVNSRGPLPWVLWSAGAVGVTGVILTRAARPEGARAESRRRALATSSTFLAISGVIGGSIAWFALERRAPEQRVRRGDVRIGIGQVSLTF